MKVWKVEKRTKNTAVKKGNKLARARILADSVWEGRIINSVVAQIRTEDEDFREYKVPIIEVIPENFKGKEMGGRTFLEIKKSAVKVCDKILIFDNGKKFSAIVPFIRCDVEDGIISVKINPDLKEYLLKLKSNFTTFLFSDFLKLSTTYSQRLFEVLSSWKNKEEGYVDISLSALHEQLNTKVSYRRNFDFLNRCIERCKKDIDDKHTELKFTYEPLKKQGSKKVVSVRFVLDAEKFELYKKSLTAKTSKSSDKPLAKAVIKPLKGIGFDAGSFDNVEEFEVAV